MKERSLSLNEFGLLPEGIHECALTEIEECFGKEGNRPTLWNGFVGFIERLQYEKICESVLVDGRFITAWDDVDDVDVVLEVDALRPGQTGSLKMLLSEQVKREFYEDFRVNLRVLIPGFFGRDYRSWFQQIKTEDAWRVGGSTERLRKGILRIRI